MRRKVFVAADHGGFQLKERLKIFFSEQLNSYEFIDLGTDSSESVDYPDFAQKLCLTLRETFRSEDLLEPCGILICGSGVGVSIAANRFPFVRAALVHGPELARLSRQHNAANVLCLGGRFMDPLVAQDCVKLWLETPFEGGRHLGRIQKLNAPHL